MEIENLFASVGLRTPVMRFAGVAGATAGVLYLVKPNSMFNADGTMKCWSVTAPDGTPAGQCTTVPLWRAAAGLGVTAALFV